MDFFASQDRARASTRRLIVLYTLALIGVVVSLNLVAVIAFGLAGSRLHRVAAADHVGMRGPVDWGRATSNLGIYGVTTLSVLTLVALATLIKQMQIGGDGAKLAELLGGRPIAATTVDLDERKLTNIVEEMSLASGVPTPRIFLLDGEHAINAFAAGTRPEAAVIGVTRGAVQSLNRDELQGVIAHEFSHILNGDMRLNLRLIALNFGIMAIGYIGLQVLRFMPNSSSSSRSSNSDRKDGGNATVVIFVVALGMMIIGYAGTFFGKMLQAAVSRQREYLADASAVQFTRNPKGISDALKKIGGLTDGATLETSHAGEASHMFFADGVVGFLDSVFATHPPLRDRIRAIDPSFTGSFPAVAAQANEDDAGMPAISSFATQPRSIPPRMPRAGQAIAATPADLRAARSVIAPREMTFAAITLDALPDALRSAARDPYDARALALGLLLDADVQLRQSQLNLLAKSDPAMAQLAATLYPSIVASGPAARLPLLDLALPALHGLSTTQRADFRALCDACAAADGQLSPFELALSCVLESQLKLPTDAASPTADYRSVSAVRDAAADVLSALASAGGEEQADAAFAAGAARLGIDAMPARRAGYDAAALKQALATLRGATAVIQQRIVEAAAFCVAADRVVRIEEIELMRALCAAFAVPIPPFLLAA